jgi:hypothetical protein
MPLFSSSGKNNKSIDAGPALVLKPSPWRKLFRKRRRRPSLSSEVSQTFSDLSRHSSHEDVRVIGHVEEIKFRDDTPESMYSDSLSRKDSQESLSVGIKRDLFSERTLYMDALDGQEGEIQRFDTMKSVYVDAMDGLEKVEVKESMEIAVVAEVHEGMFTCRFR